MHALLLRPWRGNARELRSFLEEAVILSEAGVLDATPDFLDQYSADYNEDNFPVLKKKVQQAERKHITLALTHSQGNVGESAKMLGISRKTLWEKMKRLNLSAPKV